MFVSATLVGRSLVLSLSKPSLWADTARGWFWWVRHGMQDYIAMVVKYAHPHNKRENVKNISPPFMGVCACFGVFIIYLFIPFFPILVRLQSICRALMPKHIQITRWILYSYSEYQGRVKSTASERWNYATKNHFLLVFNVWSSEI